jgi:hypothetical protein
MIDCVCLERVRGGWRRVDGMGWEVVGL